MALIREQGLWITRRGFFVCFVFKDSFRRNLPGTEHTQIPNPPDTPSLVAFFKRQTALAAVSSLLCILHAFPPSSRSPLVIWPHLNESKKIKGPDYIQSSCHGLWEGRIANTSVQMVQSLLPPFTPAVVLHVLTFPRYVAHTGGPWHSVARSGIYWSSQTPPPFTSELTLSMQITLIQNSQERKLGGFPVLWEIFFPFGKGRGGREWGVVALFFTARCRSLWLISKKVQFRGSAWHSLVSKSETLEQLSQQAQGLGPEQIATD